MLGIGSPGKGPGLFLAGEVVLAGGTALCVPCKESCCDGAALHLRQNNPKVSPWSSVSGCTPVAKADWLQGAAAAITNAIGSHTGLRFWLSCL